MSAVLTVINSVKDYTFTVYLLMKSFFSDSLRRLKEDERGLEVIQVIIILLIIVVIVAVVWTFLKEWVTMIFERIQGA